MSKHDSTHNEAWYADETRRLRSEQPSEEAVSRSVLAMQSQPAVEPRNRRPTFVISWRTTAALASVAMITTVFLFRPSTALASELKSITSAMMSQRTRYTMDYRPSPKGLTLVREEWIEGDKEAYWFTTPDQTQMGYDGHQMYLVRRGGPGFIDDAEPSRIPRETIEDYLNITGGKLLGVKRGIQERGHVTDIFEIGFGTLQMSLFVDPATHLPIRRDVTVSGKLIERDVYEYPADIPNERFAPAVLGSSRVARMPWESRNGLSEVPVVDSTWTNYAQLRPVLANLASAPGKTARIGAEHVSVKAVVAGPRQVIVIWSGANETEPVSLTTRQGGPLFAAPDRLDERATASYEGLHVRVFFPQTNPDLGDIATVNIPLTSGVARIDGVPVLKAEDPQRVLAKTPGEATSGSARGDQVKTR